MGTGPGTIMLRFVHNCRSQTIFKFLDLAISCFVFFVGIFVKDKIDQRNIDINDFLPFSSMYLKGRISEDFICNKIPFPNQNWIQNTQLKTTYIYRDTYEPT
jgi:hypothetical protein